MGEPWPSIHQLVTWLENANGHTDLETTLQLGKIAEEYGEVMAAWIGVTGQNPRKGVTHERSDVAAELCDVIITAMVALHRFSDDPPAELAARLSVVVARSTP